MFCKFCGKQIDDDSIFCPVCGGNLGNNTLTVANDFNPIVTINDTEINIVSFCTDTNLFDKHTSAIAAKRLKEMTQCDLKEAVNYISEWQQDTQLMQLAQQEAEKRAQSLESTLHCPKCNSTNIYIDKQGFKLSKSIIGGILLGPIGLLGGAYKKNKLRFTCLSCKHQWK